MPASRGIEEHYNMTTFENIDLEAGEGVPPPYTQYDNTPANNHTASAAHNNQPHDVATLYIPPADRAAGISSATPAGTAIGVSRRNAWSMWRNSTGISRLERYRTLLICLLVVVAVVVLPGALYMTRHQENES